MGNLVTMRAVAAAPIAALAKPTRLRFGNPIDLDLIDRVGKLLAEYRKLTDPTRDVRARAWPGPSKRRCEVCNKPVWHGELYAETLSGWAGILHERCLTLRLVELRRDLRACGYDPDRVAHDGVRHARVLRPRVGDHSEANRV